MILEVTTDHLTEGFTITTTTTPPYPGLKPFITYEAAADLLDVDKRTIRRAVERGEVTARRFGRAVRIDTVSLMEAFAPVGVSV